MYDLGRTMLWIARGRRGQAAPQPIQPRSGVEGSEAAKPVVAAGIGAAAGTTGAAVAEEGRAGGGLAAASATLRDELSRLTLDAQMPREELEQELEQLRSYDPCLMLLLEWMTDNNEKNRADMMDVLRHP